MSAPSSHSKSEKGPLAQQDKGDDVSTTVLETGLIYWFYRPKVAKTEAHSADDVARLYFLLCPSACTTDARHGNENTTKRLLVMTSKRMPDVSKGGHGRNWAFVDMVSKKMSEIHELLEKKEYDTKTRGHREVFPARPAGEGVYELLRHEHSKGKTHTSLAYVLEVPPQPGAVQKAFNIEKRAAYIVSVKNPMPIFWSDPTGEHLNAPGLGQAQKAEFGELQEKFKGKRVSEKKWVDVDPPEFLNFEHAELLMIGEAPTLEGFGKVGATLEELEKEDEATAKKRFKGHLEDKPFEELGLEKDEHPAKPLTGEWA